MPRRDLRLDAGDHVERAPVAVHRARRRLQPGPDRARQRDHQRDHARLTRQQARERFDDIIAFAELEEFLDLKLKNYSSGMTVRLGFSVAIQVDAEVLLIDEVLAVGDAAFQQKCFEEFQRMKDEGRTILFVTHDMGAVERFCDRAMLLETGRDASTSASRTRSRAATTSSTSGAPSTATRAATRSGGHALGRDRRRAGSRTPTASAS